MLLDSISIGSGHRGNNQASQVLCGCLVSSVGETHPSILSVNCLVVGWLVQFTEMLFVSNEVLQVFRVLWGEKRDRSKNRDIQSMKYPYDTFQTLDLNKPSG